MSNTQYAGADVVDVVVTANTTVNSIVAQGGIVGVAQNTVLAGEETPVIVTGIHRLTKFAGVVAAAGAPARYSLANQRLQDDGELVVGIYASAAGETDPRALVQLGRERGESQRVVDRVRIDGAANATRTAYSRAPFPGARTAISYVTDAKPTSAAGTQLLTVKAGATTLLSTANVAASGFTEDAETSFTLTATTADLACDEGDLTAISLVSNNADGVPGAGIDVFITYERA